MRFEHRKELNAAQLAVFPEEGSEKLKGYKIMMITNARIPGFASCRADQLDGQDILYYDVTGHISLKQYLSQKPADAELFKELAKALAGAQEVLEKHMLGVLDMLTDPQCVFLREDGAGRQADAGYGFLFMCYPDPKDYFEMSKALGEALLMKMRHDDKETVGIGYRFYQMAASGELTNKALKDLAYGTAYRGFNSGRDAGRDSADAEDCGINTSEIKKEKENFSFLYDDLPVKEKKKGESLIKKIIEKIRGRASKKKLERKRPAYFGSVTGESDESIVTERVNALNNGSEPYEVFDEITGSATGKDFGIEDNGIEDNGIENNGPETVFLGRPERKPDVRAWLIPVSSFEGVQQSIGLEKDIYLAGRKIAGADISMESPAVSRIHARIIWKGASYEMIDLGSRNGSFVNGGELEAGKAVLLKDGDEIVFGDVHFRFCLTEDKNALYN